MVDSLSKFARHQPTCFPCFEDPEVKALASEMFETVSELLMDVDTHLGRFVKTLMFPASTFRKVRDFRLLYDRFLAEVIARANLNITCSAGCPSCCHTLPCGVEPLEIIDIYEHVRSRKDFPFILRRCSEALENFQKLFRETTDAAKQHPCGHSDAFASAFSKFPLFGIPCAFLDSNRGICRIYDVRPIICRSVFSLSHPALCDPAHRQYEDRVLEVIEPVDEINYRLIQINARISEALGLRFPEMLQHGLLAWHRLVREKNAS